MLSKFKYVKPRNLEEALEVLNTAENAAIVGGGTDLLVQNRAELVEPSVVVDVKEIHELKQIQETDKSVLLGSAVTFSRIIDSDVIGKHASVLMQASQHVGSPQIRNQGTIGGNVQTASPAGDGLVALYGMDAEIELISLDGVRRIPIQEYVVGPKKTIKKQNELIRGFVIEKQKWGFSRFFKLGKRNALAISIVNGVINIAFDDDMKVSSARITLGAVAPTPIQLTNLERALLGKKYSEELSGLIRQKVHETIEPISDIRASKKYRRYIAAIICDRIFKEASGYGGAGNDC